MSIFEYDKELEEKKLRKAEYEAAEAGSPRAKSMDMRLVSPRAKSMV